MVGSVTFFSGKFSSPSFFSKEGCVSLIISGIPNNGLLGIDKFPSLGLAIYAARRGGTFPSVLNAVDEEVVEAFLNKKIHFSDIYKTVENVVRRHRVIKKPTLKQIMSADLWAREEAKRLISR